MSKRLKNRYIQTIGVTVIVLALVRCVFPGIATGSHSDDDVREGKLQNDSAVVEKKNQAETPVTEKKQQTATPVAEKKQQTEMSVAEEAGSSYDVPHLNVSAQTRYVADGERYHRIISVPSYATCFPDSNYLQLQAAQHWGVSPVKNRTDAESRKNELVYIGACPYYEVAKLDASIPYLVPRAALLLHDIGQSFLDSLQVKGIPLHRFIVSSVLRSEEDVARLRRSNKNATEQSCHLYGTTFDINYNVYAVVTDPDGLRRDDVNDTRLKQILSEVLNDMRRQGRCYVKYEIKQPCFHITVR